MQKLPKIWLGLSLCLLLTGCMLSYEKLTLQETILIEAKFDPTI